MDIDIDEFFSELDRRMSMPEEGSREYLQRLASYAKREPRSSISRFNGELGDVIEPAVGEGVNANSTCKPRDRKSEYIRSDSRNIVKRQTTPQPTPIAKHRKTFLQVDRGDHSDDSACIQPPNLVSKILPLSSSPLNRNTDSADCPQPDPSIIFAATLRERGDLFSEQADVHDTIMNSSPEPVKQADSRIRSPSLAPAETPEQLSPITSFQTTSNISVKDLLPKKPVVAKPAAIDLLPLDDPKTKRTVRSKGRVESGIDDPPSSPIEDPSSSSIPLKSEPSLYLQLREKIAQHESMKKQTKLLKRGDTEISEQGVKDGNPMTQIKASDEIREASSSASDNPARKRRKLDTAVSKSCIEKLTTKDPAKGNAKGKGKEKDNSKKLPHEYAQFLVDRAKEEPLGKKRPQFLEGKTIFYTGGDFRQASATTRARMELIIKHGGTLAPKFDPSTVTHVIACCTLGTAVDAMGLKSWREIPDHIPTVNWNWVADSLCIKEMTKEEFDEHQIFQYAAFVERIDVGVEKYPRRTRSNHSNLGEGTSNRKEKNIEIPQTGSLPAHAAPACDAAGPRRSPACTPPSPTPPNHRGSGEVELQPSSPVSSVCPLPVTDKDDPLAEYYLQALAEHDAQSGRPGEEESDNDDDDDDNTTPVINPTPKRGWTCDQKRVQIKNCPNQDVIDKLEELKNLHDVKPGQDEKWRVFTYSKCIPALRIYPKRIKSFSEARSIRGVGDKTARKIMEIIKTGNLSRIDYEKTEDVQVTRLFTGIYGVGQPTAYKWYAAGCRTLDDLKAGKCGVKLIPAQEIGLRYYDDINDRTPRTEAKAIFDLIKPIALSIDSKLFVEIMGSYRRGKADCGDIDILITRKPEGDTTHAGVLSRLLQKLHKVGILTEDLALPEHPDDLEAIYRGLCHLPTSGSRRRRIDFLTVPWESRGAALLYYTGDDIFNRAIRLKANALGYSLNQRGLFSKVIRDPRDKRVKLNKGVLLASETEQEIFKILGVPWQEPHERVRR